MSAQIGPGGRDYTRPDFSGNIPTNPEDSTEVDDFIERDSFEYNYYYMGKIFERIIFQDTSIVGKWSNVDKTQMQEFQYLNLGNLGSSSTSAVHQNGTNTGFQLGYDQYSVYNFTLDSFKFYDVNRPLADLYFSPFLGSQDNFIVQADFAQKFDNGVSMSLNFHRVNQKGFYVNQQAKTTNFALGVKKESMNGRLNSFFVILNNINTEKFNGGITTDSLFDKPNYNFRERIPTFRNAANMRMQEQNVVIQNTYRLGDSIIEPSDFVLQHRFTYQTEEYKFFDSINKGGANFYGPYFTEDRGVRVYNDVLKIRNDFSLYNATSGGISGQLGIFHDYIRWNNEAQKTVRNDITAYAQGVVPIGKLLNLDVDGKLGLGSNVGRFYGHSSLDLSLGKWASISPGISLYNLEPGSIVYNVAVNGQSYINKDRKGIQGFTIYGQLKVPKTATRVNVSQGVAKNMVYWDSLALPQQIESSVSQTVVSIDQNFSLFKFHLDNSFTYQQYSSDRIQLPNWFSKHRLYYAGKLFKKVLDVQIGIERQMIPKYKGLAFMPLNGRFYNADDDVPAFNMTAAFINAKVSTFRFFIRLDNLEDYFHDSVYFQIYKQPWNDGKLRLGLRWQLLD